MIWKASLVLCLAMAVLSYRPAISEQKFSYHHHGDLKHIGKHEPDHHEVYASAHPSYEFSYHVDDPHTHDKKGQHEVRDGDKVSGNYWLLQPDGRKRTVKYNSNHKDGFHADVKYSPHEAHHPHHHGIEEHYHEKKEHHKMKHHHHHEEHKHRDDHDHDHIKVPDYYEENLHNKKNPYYKQEYSHDDDHDQKPQYKVLEPHKHHHEKNQFKVTEHHHDDHEGHKKHVPHLHIHDIKSHHEDKGHESWGWFKPPSVHKHHSQDGHKDSHNVGHRHGHTEHWKHGVMVGWNEGTGHDHSKHDDDHDRHHNSHGGKGNFKVFVPYGHRLH